VKLILDDLNLLSELKVLQKVMHYWSFAVFYQSDVGILQLFLDWNDNIKIF